jgi:hypothetical protein
MARFVLGARVVQLGWVLAGAKELAGPDQAAAHAFLIPRGKASERVLRHEAHLDRQLRHALEKLEVLQRQRNGEPVPFARLEISGLDDSGAGA